MSIESHNHEHTAAAVDSQTDDQDTDDSYERAPRYFLPIIAAIPLATLALNLFLVNSETINYNVNAATDHSDRNDKVSTLVSEVTGIPLRVDCDNDVIDTIPLSSEDGQSYGVMGFVAPLHFMDVYLSVPVMTLREEICDTVLGDEEAPTYTSKESNEYYEYIDYAARYADSLSIVLHETEHIKQVRDEAEASCYAYQKLPDALVKLGMDEEDADKVARIALDEASDVMMDDYYSEECRPGGAYDIAESDLFLQSSETTVAQN